MPNLVPVSQIVSEEMSAFDFFGEKSPLWAFLKVNVTLTFGLRPLVKATVGSICESPFSPTTIMPNSVPVGQIVAEKMSNV